MVEVLQFCCGCVWCGVVFKAARRLLCHQRERQRMCSRTALELYCLMPLSYKTDLQYHVCV